MSLNEYRRKRDFKKTSEPKPSKVSSRKKALRFVVQKHAASHLHYDFRLELDGTLKSWAVPKGPSLDPSRKQLAVHVEDHPLAYADFEGTIPKGEYGGGTVMVWDQGTWESQEDPAKSYQAGKLKFTLHGEKLQGNWMLVRMGGQAGEDGKNWLLMKEKDSAARPTQDFDITKEEPLSVVSGRDLPDIAEGLPTSSKKQKDKSSATASRRKLTAPKKSSKPERQRHFSRMVKKAAPTGARKDSLLPARLEPQLATLVSEAPQGKNWLHEMKFDGYRLLAFIEEGEIRLITRKHHDWTGYFSPIEKSLKKLPLSSGILDGEVVVLRDGGIPDFQKLQNAIQGDAPPEFVYYVFDLPFYEGEDLRNDPLVARKKKLQKLLKKAFPDNDGTIRFSDHIEGQGSEVAQQSCQHELEGIISKRSDSHYHSGRTKDWVKTKCHRRQEFVIGGYTSPKGNRSGFGSLLIGVYDDGKLKYCGKVGTGFTAASIKEIHGQLKSQSTDVCPFEKFPREARRDLKSWTKPNLVAEVEFTEWTNDDILRHPSFKGMREDKQAKSITKEVPVKNGEAASGKAPQSSQKSASSGSAKSSEKLRSSESSDTEIAGVRISNPDRVVFPEINVTKGDLAQFYFDIADWILPHVTERPLSLVRCPSGAAEQCFYQKHYEGTLPAGVSTVRIQEKSKAGDYPVIHDVTGLISLIQWGVLEIHPWGAKADDVERPDRIIFDLDPGPDVKLPQVIQAVKDLRALLDELKLTSFLRTSGGKGFHIVIPFRRGPSWEEVKGFAKDVAEIMAHAAPDLYLANMSKSKRAGKIFIDYLRNGRGSTAITSYGTRARATGAVATPLRWEELTAKLRPDRYTIRNLKNRLTSLTADPWDGFFNVRQSLTKTLMAAVRQKES